MNTHSWIALCAGTVLAAPGCATAQASLPAVADSVEAQGFVGGHTPSFLLDGCPTASASASAIVSEMIGRDLAHTARAELAIMWQQQIASCGDEALHAWFVESFRIAAGSGTSGGWSFVDAVPASMGPAVEESFWDAIHDEAYEEELRAALALRYSEQRTDAEREQTLLEQWPRSGTPSLWAGSEARRLIDSQGGGFVSVLAAILPDLDQEAAATAANAVYDAVVQGAVAGDAPAVAAMAAAVEAYGTLGPLGPLLGGPLPEVAYTITLEAIADTYLKQGTPNKNQGAEGILRIRSSGKNRALVAVDESEVLSIAGQIVSARIEFDIVFNGNNWGTGGRTVDAHRMLVAWTHAGATWNCADDSDPSDGGPDCGSTAWEMGSLDPSPFDPVPSGTILIERDMLGTFSIDVTADVEAFRAGTVPNLGWILKKTNEGQAGHAQLGSIESGSGPRLVVQTTGGN